MFRKCRNDKRDMCNNGKTFMYTDELHNAIMAEEDIEYEPRPRVERKVERVQHKTEVGELVFNYWGKNAPQLLFMATNNLASEMLSKGYLWWNIEKKIKEIFFWCKSKGTHPMVAVKILNNEIKKIK